MKYLLIVAVLCFGLMACSVEPSKLGSGQAKDMAGKMTYFKDKRTGLCYATVASRRTLSWSSSGLGVTCVPCESLKNMVVHTQGD